MMEKSNDNVTWTHFWAFLGVLIVLLGVAFGAAFAVGRYAMDMQQQALERHDEKDVHPGAVRKDYYELDMRHLKEDIQNSRDIMIKKFKELAEEQRRMNLKIETNKERINLTGQNILSQLQDIKKKIGE